jgi:MFS family permease
MSSNEIRAMQLNHKGSHIATVIYPFMIAQVLSGSTIVVLTSLSGIIGNGLSPRIWLVTLPNSLTILGTLISIWPIAKSIGKLGWRWTLLAGICTGVIGASVAIFAIGTSNFAAYCFACVLLGGCIASVQYYVFGATESARNTAERRVVISLVTACGFISAFLGSGLVRFGSYFVGLDQKACSFVALIGILILAAISLAVAPYPEKRPTQLAGPKIAASGWREMFGGPLCGMILSAAAFANMTFLMHATPIAMQICGFGGDAIASVLQWHFVAMYTPAVITGVVAARLPPSYAASLGLLVGAAACILGYSTDQTISSFMLTLATCGIAWGLTFPAGMALMIEHSDPSRRVGLQGLATLIVYGTNCVSSFSTGPAVDLVGWQSLNLIAIGPLCVGACAVGMGAFISTSKN